MSTSKHFDKICIASICIALVLAIAFTCVACLGLIKSGKTMGYENTLFDTSSVHTINIVMNDWDSFIETCENEEYSACTVVIDGVKISNIGIRAKGNTSLSSVKSMGSQRYSLKLEFDQYETGKNYYGLDKLCLNNLIQDNTMMKDYIVYQMMNKFGVDTPLCSYTYITVNGEDWGLYLAVESVEDSFQQRNYGSTEGELYKPDTMSNGGGRGNGKDFDMDKITEDSENVDNTETTSETQNTTATESNQSDSFGGFSPNDMPSGGPSGGGMPSGGNMPSGDFDPNNMPSGDFDPNNMPSGDFDPNNMPSGDFSQGNNPFGTPPDMNSDNNSQDSQSESTDETTDQNDKKSISGIGGFSFFGSDDVKLKYIDDDPDSYSNIFNNAKTDVTKADKNRLISSLKNLSSYTDLENTVDIDEVIRYFVIHNFVVNGDSYTGTMIHNYYLYEDDGQLSMIPWDYNLAFGTFMGGSASSSVNSDIDSPVSNGSVDDRPMVGFIFSSEEYTNQYHKLFQEFINEYFSDSQLANMIAETAAMIKPYVEKDPTKFCTTDEFDTGVKALTEFVTLRAESVANQLDGNDETIDASSLNTSDMGSMGGSFGGNKSGFNKSSVSKGTTEETTQTEGTEYSTPSTETKEEPSQGSLKTPDNTSSTESINTTGLYVYDTNGNEIDINEIIPDISILNYVTLQDDTTIFIGKNGLSSLTEDELNKIKSVTDKEDKEYDLSKYIITNSPKTNKEVSETTKSGETSPSPPDNSKNTTNKEISKSNFDNNSNKASKDQAASSFSMNDFPNSAESSINSVILIIISFIVLGAGLLFAIFKKKR